MTSERDSSSSSNDLLSCEGSSKGSSVTSLIQRLRNLPIPTLSERLAAFDRRLQWDEWRWQVHRSDQFLTYHEEENDDRDNFSTRSDTEKPHPIKTETTFCDETLDSTLDNKTMPRTSKPGIKAVDSKTDFNSKIAHPCHGKSDKESHLTDVKKHSRIPTMSTRTNLSQRNTISSSSSSYKTSRPPTPCSINSHRNGDRKIAKNTMESLKKRLAATWKESQGSNELPILPSKNIRYKTCRPKSLKSSSQFELAKATSGSDIEDEPLNRELLMQQQDESSTRSKISESSFKVGVGLPRIESGSSSDGNLALEVFKSRKELIQLADRFQLKRQLSNSGLPKPPDSQIRPLYFRKSSFHDGSSSSFNSKYNFQQSSLSTPTDKMDNQLRNFDYAEPPCFYTDRPKFCKRATSVLVPKANADRNGRSSGENSVEIPLLDIRSLSNSVDSGDTYIVHSTKRIGNKQIVEAKSSSNEADKCICFHTSDISPENGASWRSNISNKSNYLSANSKNRPQLGRRRSCSKIPVRITPDRKKAGSSSSECKSPSSSGSENSHVSEYESKTMVVVTSSQSLLKCSAPSNEGSGRSIVYRVSISNEDKEDVKSHMEMQALLPAMFMNIQGEKSNIKCKSVCTDEINNFDKSETSTDRVTDKMTANSDASDEMQKEAKSQPLTEGNSILKDYNSFQNLENKTTCLRSESQTQTESEQLLGGTHLKAEELIMKSEDGSENDVEELKCNARKDQLEKILVSKIGIPRVKSESATNLQNKARMDRVKLLTCSASASSLNCLELKKDVQDRFPFTMSQTARPNSTYERANCSKKFLSENELHKHPSIIRLANIGVDPDSSEIINFLSFNPRTKNYNCKKKGFLNKLKSKLIRIRKSDQSKEFKINYDDREPHYERKLLKVRSCNELRRLKPKENTLENSRIYYNSVSDRMTVQSAESREVLKEIKTKICDDDWVQAFDSTSEVSLIQDVSKSAHSKEQSLSDQKSLNEQFKNDEMLDIAISKQVLPSTAELDAEIGRDGCLCFKWCNF